jgi:hypothetical protein
MFAFDSVLVAGLLKATNPIAINYCGRGQLFELLGNQCSLSRKKAIPPFLRSQLFRYGFLIFFFCHVF